MLWGKHEPELLNVYRAVDASITIHDRLASVRGKQDVLPGAQTIPAMRGSRQLAWRHRGSRRPIKRIVTIN